MSPEVPLSDIDPSTRLPHRYPFLLLDRIDELEPGVRATAMASVSVAQPFPQILLVESVAQLAGVLTIQQEGEGGFLAAIDRAEFGRSPQVGDRLTVNARLLKSFGRLFLVEGEVVCVGDVLLRAQLALGVGTL